MKITREEFKELIRLSNTIRDRAFAAEEFVDGVVVYNLAYPVLNWISDKLADSNEYWEWNLLGELHTFKHHFIANDYTDDDLDKIYDGFLDRE